MTTNNKLIICTLVIITIFSLSNVVSASDSTNDHLSLEDTSHETFSVDGTQSSLTDTNTNAKTKQISSDTDKNKKTNTTSSSVSKEKTTKSNNTIKEENSNTDEILKSFEMNDKLGDGTKRYISPTGSGDGTGNDENNTATLTKETLNKFNDNDIIYLKEGNYSISEVITLPSKSLTFIGEDNTKLIRTKTNIKMFSYTTAKANTFSFNNLIFTNTQGSTELIYLSELGTFKFNNCK